MKQTQQQFPAAAWQLSLNNSLGLYIHVPFCESKCAYCDFYSYKADDITYNNYTDTICRHIKLAGQELNKHADTLYFGGGTPSLLGGKRIAEIITACKQGFGLENAEITVEANPADNLANELKTMADACVTRLSLGVQSGIDNELKSLSRRHTNLDVIRTVSDAKNAGIHNISLDLMLGIPKQTLTSIKESLDFLISLNPTHISCYMLKIEPNTAFGRTDLSELGLPDEDTVADMYLYTSDYLAHNGFEHYEISNFAKDGFKSRHNTKYWLCEEYLGLGPSAHSYLNGKRFRFDRDIKQYLSCPTVIDDGLGGDFEEYVMLGLRLKDGVNFREITRLFDKEKAEKLKSNAAKLKDSGLINLTDEYLSLTIKGFLVSNSVITELIF